MKMIMGLGAMLLAGFLVISGNLGLTGQALAQGGGQTTQDKQLQEQRQKPQMTLPEQEREVAPQPSAFQRQQDATKRQQDALKRQKAAEKRLQELEEGEK
jgi:hypothetical protein